jgi:pimeloyl-ACP methyl ester carboxylesterase
LFIGAEFDSIFDKTEEAVLAARRAPNLRDPVWIAGSGHWIQQGGPTRSQALLGFLRRLPDSPDRAA